MWFTKDAVDLAWHIAAIVSTGESIAAFRRSIVFLVKLDFWGTHHMRCADHAVNLAWNIAAIISSNFSLTTLRRGLLTDCCRHLILEIKLTFWLVSAGIYALARWRTKTVKNWIARFSINFMGLNLQLLWKLIECCDFNFLDYLLGGSKSFIREKFHLLYQAIELFDIYCLWRSRIFFIVGFFLEEILSLADGGFLRYWYRRSRFVLPTLLMIRLVLIAASSHDYSIKVL